MKETKRKDQKRSYWIKSKCYNLKQFWITSYNVKNKGVVLKIIIFFKSDKSFRPSLIDYKNHNEIFIYFVVDVDER